MIFPSDEYDTSEKSSAFVVEKFTSKVRSNTHQESSQNSLLDGVKKLNRDFDQIIISLPYTVSESDLQFLGFSQIDNRPIYKYVGQDFSKFSHPYEECVLLPPAPPPERIIIE